MLKTLLQRDGNLIAEGAGIGTTGAFLLVAAHFLSLHLAPELTPFPERILLESFGLSIRSLLEATILVSQNGGIYLLTVPLLLLAWRPTRQVAIVLIGIVLELCVAWGTALIILLAYNFDPLAGLLCVPLAVPLALILGRWRRLSPGAMVVIVAAHVVLFVSVASPVGSDLSGFWRCWWILPLAVIVASLTIRFGTASLAAPRSRFVDMWGLSGLLLGTVLLLAISITSIGFSEPSLNLYLESPATDVLVIGTPPQLLWTDNRAIRVLPEAYGHSREPYLLDSEAQNPWQIWPSAFGGFFVQTCGTVKRWRSPPAGGRISDQPEVQFQFPSTSAFGKENEQAAAVVEDPFSRRLLAVSEWSSNYTITEIDTGRILLSARLTGTNYPYVSATFDPVTKVVYVTAFLDDGGLYVLDLASLEVKRTVPGLYLHRTVLDHERDVLWGARPMTGEVVGVDLQSFEVRYRVRLGWGIRDLELDPESGDIYTCSFLNGEVFRIDPATRTSSVIGRCGSYCRYLFLDSPNRTLWVASQAGICLVPLPALNPEGTVAPGPAKPPVR